MFDDNAQRDLQPQADLSNLADTLTAIDMRAVVVLPGVHRMRRSALNLRPLTLVRIRQSIKSVAGRYSLEPKCRISSRLLTSIADCSCLIAFITSNGGVCDHFKH